MGIKLDGDTADTMELLSIVVVLAATARFLLEGLSFKVVGHPLSFGHIDPLTYAALLSPVLGAHGYLKIKKAKTKKVGKVDDPS